MKMKVGTMFTHRKWVGDAQKPLVCIVTAIRDGYVYWKPEGARKAKDCFPVSEAGNYVQIIMVLPK